MGLKEMLEHDRDTISTSIRSTPNQKTTRVPVSRHLRLTIVLKSFMKFISFLQFVVFF